MFSTTSPRVGPELRSAREAAGISREQLARLADCSVNWIEQLEVRAVAPTRSDALPRIWRALDALRDRPGEGGDV
jgi:predicted transcriptional regulator